MLINLLKCFQNTLNIKHISFLLPSNKTNRIYLSINLTTKISIKIQAFNMRNFNIQKDYNKIINEIYT